MSDSKSERSLDAVRLLCNAIQKLHYFDFHDQAEAMSPACKTLGELILQDALEYLAWGDTCGARSLIALYEEWEQTGEAPWPYDSSKSPPKWTDRPRSGLTEDPGGGVTPEDDLDDDIPF